MKKISDLFYLNNARNSEHYNLYTQILKITSEDFAKKYKLTAFRDSLAASFEKEDEAYLQTLAFADTKEIDQKDEERDTRLRQVDLTVQSKVLSLIEAEVEAGKQVNFAIDPYRGAASKPLAENTAMVEDMVKKLQSAQYAPLIETLGLTAAVAALKKANDEFVEAYSRRADEKRIRATTDNLKKVRPQVDEAAKKMFEAINALYLVNDLIEKDATKAAELGAVIDALNAQILQFSETLSRRGAGKKKKIEPDDKPVVPPEEGGDDSGGEEGGGDSGGEEGGGDDRPEIE